MNARYRCLPVSLLGLSLLTSPAPAAAAEKGTYWELTTEMEMVGMPFAMPPTVLKVCQPDGDWKRPPKGKDDGNCQMKDVRTSGQTMKWRMVCTGKEPMEGDGEMTRSGDAFQGRTHVRMAQGEMNMKMRGKKLGGACDPEEPQRQAEAAREQVNTQMKQAEAQRNAAQAKQCDDGIKNMQAMAVAGSYQFCTDPAKRAEFCARVRTEEGYGKLMRHAREEQESRGKMPGPQAAAKACQLDLDEVARELCAAAARKENLVYLAGWCPAEAKVIARRECAGRDYTSLQGSKYRDFCSRLKGADMEAKGESDAVPEKRKKKEDQEGATEKGKKLLKGVLGF